MFRPGRALPVLRGPVFESNSSRTTFSALPVVHSNRSFSNYSTAQLTAQFRPLSPLFFSASRSVLPRITVRFPSNPQPFSSHYSTQFRPQLKPQFRLFSPSRPTLPRTTLRLSAPLSSAAQRILDDVEAHETGALYTEAPRIPATVHDIGDFSLMGLVDGWGPSDLMIQLLEFIKVSSGLPWWAAIGCLTLIWRVCFFPNALGLARNAATLPYINDKLEELKKTSAEARASGELLRMRQASTDMLDLYREWGYRPMIGVFTIFQIPIFITVFRTLTRCSYFPAPGWEAGGMLWFKDLTVPDPYMILPLVSAITTGMSLMLNAKDQPTRPEGMVGLIICISPLLSLAFVPVIGMMQPASVFLYWTVNNFIQLFQVFLFRTPVIRKALGIRPRLEIRPSRPGIKGFFMDRIDDFVHAWRTFQKQRDEQRRQFKMIGIDKDLKYESKSKVIAKVAKAAGKIEKL